LVQRSDHDLEALQGSWRQVGLEVEGILNPPDDLSPPGAITFFTDSHFTVRTAGGVLLLEGTFALDASVTPKAIDYVDSMGLEKGKRLAAIYKLEGDIFTFIAASERDPRPTTFRTGPGQTMRTFIRCKPSNQGTASVCGVVGSP
jgi:uncharacterized protein (TIGR03067 family)